jgi:hypothetical protein
MWLSAIKLAVSAGSKIYANKQKNKNGNVRCTAYACTKMAEGEELTRVNFRSPTIDWKDEAVLVILSLPVHSGACLGSRIGRSNCYGQGKIFFEMFSQLPSMVHKFWILVVARFMV